MAKENEAGLSGGVLILFFRTRLAISFAFVAALALVLLGVIITNALGMAAGIAVIVACLLGLCGYISGVIAKAAERNFWLWFALGCIGGPVTVIVILAISFAEQLRAPPVQIPQPLEEKTKFMIQAEDGSEEVEVKIEEI